MPNEHKNTKPTHRNIDSLGAFLLGEFEEIASRRQLYETRWLRDLRQYKGVYDPGILANIEKNRSKINFRTTKVKVDTSKARVMDLLFPANGEKNWGITPTPEPTVHPKLIDQKAEELTAQGLKPEDIDADAIVRQIAKENSAAMCSEMEDQLVEAPGRPSYRNVCNDVVAQAFRYGTGVLKGPLVEKRVRDRYSVDESTGEWKLGRHEDSGYRPFYEFVPIWNIYPDMSVSDPRKARFVWQDHLMSPRELADLGLMSNFSQRPSSNTFSTIRKVTPKSSCTKPT